MRRFLHPDRFRLPQLGAAALLLVYALQCVWLVRVQTIGGSLPDSDLALRMYQGMEQWKGRALAGAPESLRAEAVTGLPSAARTGRLRAQDGFDQDHSPLYYLVSAVPQLLREGMRLPGMGGPLAAALPQLFFGVMLGASLWYVSRRLYGNAGGFIALMLYCFSPGIIVNTVGAGSSGELGAMWGAFGTVFTAIAVAHTLYAPREVVLWNGRRILLLGLSMALAVGNQFSLAILLLIALPLMFWVAPVRLRAVLAIWGMAIAICFVLLFAAYCFEPRILWQGLLHARWIDFSASAFGMPFAYWNIVRSIVSGSPPLLLALPVTLAAYCGWRRARYFGNTLPLAIAGLLVIMTVGSVGFPGQGYHLVTLVFLFVFVAGMFADLLETEHQPLVAASLYGLLGASALLNLLRLYRLV